MIVLDDKIADVITNEKLNTIVTEFFVRGRKLNISLLFITQSWFTALKNIRLNSANYFIVKIPNKQKLQQISCNNLSDTDCQGFMSLYKRCTAKPYYFLVIDTTHASDSSLGFRKNLLEWI